jgi:hypothetical protein
MATNARRRRKLSSPPYLPSFWLIAGVQRGGVSPFGRVHGRTHGGIQSAQGWFSMKMVDGVEGSYEMLPRRAGGGWVQRGRHAPVDGGRHTSVCLAGRAEVSPMALNEPILSDPSSGWIGDREAPFGRRGCNGERAAGAPCQDERLANPEPQAQDFVIQTHILRNVLTQKTGSMAA